LVGQAQHHVPDRPNKGLEPTAYSVRCAPASGSGSCLAFGKPKAHLSGPRLNEHIAIIDNV
jgi:hypothetical protein